MRFTSFLFAALRHGRTPAAHALTRSTWGWLAAGLVVGFLPTVATAGGGPWTLGGGEHNVYMGGDYYRYSRFQTPARIRELPTGITASGLTGVWTAGLAYGLEMELKLAFEAVRVNDRTVDICTDPEVPHDWCAPTANIGDLGARLKWRFLDEAYGAPLSMAASLGVRTGEAYANTRGRLTTLGDGQSDVGGGLSFGRTATVAKGWYTLGADTWYWFRFPNAYGADGQKYPADEIGADVEAMVSLHPRFALGPAVSVFTRLGGEDLVFDRLDRTNPDTWNALRAQQVKLGGKLGVYSVDGGPTLSVAALTTVASANNPVGTLAISVGVGWFIAPDD